MKRAIRLIVKKGLPLIIIIVGYILYAKLANRVTTLDTKTSKVESPLVTVCKVEPQKVTLQVAAMGTVQPETETELISEVTGKIIEISDNFDVGKIFREGELILKVDNVSYQTALANADSNLMQCLLNYEAEKKRSEQAKKDWALLGQGEPSDLALRKPHLAKEASMVKATKAEVELAKSNLTKTSIYAPFTCIISSKYVDKGGYLSAGNTIAKIASVETAEVRLAIPASKIELLDLPRADLTENKQHPSVLIKAQSGNESDIYSGKIIRTEGKIDMDTRQLFAVAKIEDPYRISSEGKQLLFGTFVTAKITGKTIANVAELNSDMVDTKDCIWTVAENGTLNHQKVKVIQRIGSIIFVDGSFLNNKMISEFRFSENMEGKIVRYKTNAKPNKAKSGIAKHVGVM